MKNKELAERLLALCDTAMTDAQYCSLLAEYRGMEPQLLEALEKMAPEHRGIVVDFLGVVHAINGRMLDLALTMDEKS